MALLVMVMISMSIVILVARLLNYDFQHLCWRGRPMWLLRWLPSMSILASVMPLVAVLLKYFLCSLAASFLGTRGERIAASRNATICGTEKQTEKQD